MLMPDDLISGVTINSTFTDPEVQTPISALHSCESRNSDLPLPLPFPPELQCLPWSLD